MQLKNELGTNSRLRALDGRPIFLPAEHAPSTTYCNQPEQLLVSVGWLSGKR